jgi:hypothetical protein
LWNYGEVIRQDILENILKATAAVRDNPNPYGMSHADHTLAHEILVKEKAMPQEVENEKPCDWAAGCGNAARHKLIYADRKSTHVRFLCDDHLGGVVSDLSRRNSSGFDPVVNMSVRAAQIKHETVTRTVTRYIW